MLSADFVCCKNLLAIQTNLSIEANRVDPYQTAPIGAVWSGSMLFVIETSKHFGRQQKQRTFVVIGALTVNEAISFKNSKIQALS